MFSIIYVGSITFPGLSLVRAKDLKSPLHRSVCEKVWSLENLAGRLVEISEECASGALTFTSELIIEAQNLGKGVIWIAGTGSIFYPPDFDQAGINLQSLPIVWAKGKNESLTALELLVQSGSFELVIVDLGADWRINDASLGRMLKIAELHHAAVVFLTRKRPGDPSMGSLVSLQAEISRSGSYPFIACVKIIKDKRNLNSETQRKTYYGPCGMY